jgi:hypothetical protein
MADLNINRQSGDEQNKTGSQRKQPQGGQGQVGLPPGNRQNPPGDGGQSRNYPGNGAQSDEQQSQFGNPPPGNQQSGNQKPGKQQNQQGDGGQSGNYQGTGGQSGGQQSGPPIGPDTSRQLNQQSRTGLDDESDHLGDNDDDSPSDKIGQFRK